MGNANLRGSLYMPAMCANQCNPILKEFYNRLVSKGKPKMVALIASMRKLLVMRVRKNSSENLKAMYLEFES